MIFPFFYKVGVFKIHTIGDCYVAVNEPHNPNKASVDAISERAAVSVLHFAVRMVQAIERV